MIHDLSKVMARVGLAGARVACVRRKHARGFERPARAIHDFTHYSASHCYQCYNFTRLTTCALPLTPNRVPLRTTVSCSSCFSNYKAHLPKVAEVRARTPCTTHSAAPSPKPGVSRGTARGMSHVHLTPRVVQCVKPAVGRSTVPCLCFGPCRCLCLGFVLQ